MTRARRGPTGLQRSGLAALGVLLALALLEIGLRVAGAIWTEQQQAENTARLSDDGSIRILCLGESTTAYGYPAVLENVLNEQSRDARYSVFNEGVAGTTTDEILARLPSLLAQYDPHIVVAMVGINDPKSAEAASPLVAAFSELRVVRLFTLLGEHLSDRARGVGAGPGEATESSDDTRARLEEAELAQLARDYDEARRILVATTEVNPKAYEPWRRRIVVEQKLGEEDPSVLLAPSRAALEPLLRANPADLDTRLALARLMIDLRQYEDARDLLLAAPPPASEHPAWRRRVATTFEFPSREAARQRDWNTAVAELEAGLRALPSDAVWIRAEFHDRLARGEAKRGREGPAAHHEAEATRLRASLDRAFTAANYQRLRDRLREHDILLVASQYPGRPIAPVRDMLDDADDVVFVDNGPVFRTAVDQFGFWRVYYDEFAGDFGHMTALGKGLLAHNVAQAILEHASRNDDGPRP